MFHHLKIQKGLNIKVGTMCHTMDTNHKWCMVVDKLHNNTQFYTLEYDQPLSNFLLWETSINTSYINDDTSEVLWCPSLNNSL